MIFGQAEKQGMPTILKAGLILLVLGTVGYLYRKYLDERYEKKVWEEWGKEGGFNYLSWEISNKLEGFKGFDFIANMLDYLTVL